MARLGELLRENGVTLGVGVALLVLVGVGIRYAMAGKDAPKPKQVRMITAEIRTPPPPPPPREPPPPPKEEPKEEPQKEEPPQRLVEVKATDVPPPEGPKAEPSSGQMAMAGDNSGEGDSFGLEGSRSNKGLVGSGGVGNGEGGGGGGTGEGDGSRFGWYFGRIATKIQGLFQKSDKLKHASVRADIRVWVSPNGEVSRIQLLHTTGDPDVDREIEAVRGLSLGENIPPDLPNPARYRISAIRPR